MRRTADLGSVAPADTSSGAFRLQARSWLASLAGKASKGQRTYLADGRGLAVFEPAHLRAGHSLDTVLLVRGDFACGAGCVFHQPIYVAGHCEIGKGSRVKAVVAERSLVLAASSEVRSWAACDREMDIRSGCRIWGSAVSGTSIRMGARSAAGQLSAPEVLLQAGTGNAERPRVEPRCAVELPAPGNSRRHPARRIPGLDPALLEAASADTWFYYGDLHLAEPVVLGGHLVTRGYFACPGGSLLDGDVSAATALYVGEGSLVRGRLTAGEDLVLEARCVFQDRIRSQRRIRLCSGVRGFRAGGPVEVIAAGNLVVEDNVVIRGRLESGERVLSVARERTLPVEQLLAAGW